MTSTRRVKAHEPSWWRCGATCTPTRSCPGPRSAPPRLVRERLLAAGLQPAGAARRHRPGLRHRLGATGSSACGPTSTPCRSSTRRTCPTRSTVPASATPAGTTLHTAAVLGAGLVLAELARRGSAARRGPADLPAGRGVPAQRRAGRHRRPAASAGAASGSSPCTATRAPTSARSACAAGRSPAPPTSCMVRLTGPGGHTARPHLTADLVYALGKVVTELPAALSRRVDPRAALSLVWGRVAAGRAANAIPHDRRGRGHGALPRRRAPGRRPGAGPGRWWPTSWRRTACEAEVDVHPRTCRRCDNEPTSVGRSSPRRCSATEGPDAVVGTEQSLGGEDFAWYLASVPGALARLGVSPPEVPARTGGTCTRGGSTPTSAPSRWAPGSWWPRTLRRLALVLITASCDIFATGSDRGVRLARVRTARPNARLAPAHRSHRSCPAPWKETPFATGDHTGVGASRRRPHADRLRWRRRRQRATRRAEASGSSSAPASDLKVGLAYDIGGRGDQSFNDSAAAGLDKAADEFGVETKEAEASDGEADTAKEERLRAARQRGLQPDHRGRLRLLAARWPRSPRSSRTPSSRSSTTAPRSATTSPTSLFAEEQGSFLVGAAAALKSKAGNIGFVGGVDVPLIKKFEAGYTAGAKAVNPDIKVAGQVPRPAAGLLRLRRPGQGQDGRGRHVRRRCRRRLPRRLVARVAASSRRRRRRWPGHRRRLGPVQHRRPGGEGRHHDLDAQEGRRRRRTTSSSRSWTATSPTGSDDLRPREGRRRLLDQRWSDRRHHRPSSTSTSRRSSRARSRSRPSSTTEQTARPATGSEEAITSPRARSSFCSPLACSRAIRRPRRRAASLARKVLIATTSAPRR